MRISFFHRPFAPRLFFLQIPRIGFLIIPPCVFFQASSARTKLDFVAGHDLELPLLFPPISLGAGELALSGRSFPNLPHVNIGGGVRSLLRPSAYLKVYFRETLPPGVLTRASRAPDHPSIHIQDMSRRNTWNLDVKSLGLRGSTTPPPLKTHIAENVRILCSKVRARMRREGRRTRGLEIVGSISLAPCTSQARTAPGLSNLPEQSPPFDFKHEVAGLPGISSNE